MVIKLNLHILKIIFICKLLHHLQILLMFIFFLNFDIKFNSKFDTVFVLNLFI